MTNFDFLLDEPKFDEFSSVAITAEKIFNMDLGSSVATCRRATEFAVKWMYSVDSSLTVVYNDSFQSLIRNGCFINLVGKDLYKRIDYIRKKGNLYTHSNKKVSTDTALLCLENLHIFLDFIAYCYSENYKKTTFNKEFIENQTNISSKSNNIDLEKIKEENECLKLDLKKLQEENKSLEDELTKRRQEQSKTYIPNPLDISEYKTRKLYIDAMLEDAGWIEFKDWQNEVKLEGMPNNSNVGFADYVLYDDNGVALAIIEAKKTCVNVENGRIQAKLYADLLEKKYNRRPVIFLTNGFETRIIDNLYHERICSGIYSKRDLQKYFNLKNQRYSLEKYSSISNNIMLRYYQESAVRAVCNSFEKENRRKALLVMATGSGKTRTVIALCQRLIACGWIKNILFLADRIQLVKQAKRNFTELLPDIPIANLCEDNQDLNSSCILSTYQTIASKIDDATYDDNKKIFTCGHFDLIICDEAHRSIYKKYKDIFNYFDAFLVGLTATPKNDIDKNTYEIFDLDNGIPTFSYSLSEGVKDKILIDYTRIETHLNIIKNGITYDDLTDEEKNEYENTFTDEDGYLPPKIEPIEINKKVFNDDTIKKVLNILMTNGLKVDYGNKIGKTIIFAKNHKHAEKILEIFNKEYPILLNHAEVIDNYINYSSNAIDNFSDATKLPQIAISVDMLDTGIDIPEILNLVFFKQVKSKAKFWQMIGRGTRTCKELIDGEDKNKFYIFDFCDNFSFFNENKNGEEATETLSLQAMIFNTKFTIVSKLGELEFQTKELIDYRKSLIDYLISKVKELNKNNFSIKQHIKYIDYYSVENNYNTISLQDCQDVREELAPLIYPDNDEINALRFDYLLYILELDYIRKKNNKKAKNDLIKKVKNISNISNIPEIMVQAELINKILHTDYINDANINDYEHIRKNIRNLIKYIPNKYKKYDTNFTDEIIDIEIIDSQLQDDELEDYKSKVENYIRENIDNEIFMKLKNNEPISNNDIENLENIFWNELGSKEEYKSIYGDKPLGEFIRNITGLDIVAAKNAFADFLNNSCLNSNQIYFINQIIEYIVCNGLLIDFSVLQDSPFSDRGSIIDLFPDLNLWNSLKSKIEEINNNVLVA